MGEKGDKTRRHIRRIAFDLFAEYGYTRVTMQDISEKAGLSKGGLYRHYEDKRQLFTDILRAMQEEERDRERVGVEQGMSALEIFDGYLNHIEQDLSKASPNINMALYEFCMEYRAGEGPSIISGQWERGRAMLLSLIEYGVSEGVFHLADPGNAVSAILLLVEGMRMVNEVMPIPEETLAGVLSQIRELVGVDDEK